LAFNRFKKWCEAANERAGRRKEFVNGVLGHGHERFENMNGWRLRGFRIIDAPSDPSETF